MKKIFPAFFLTLVLLFCFGLQAQAYWYDTEIDGQRYDDAKAAEEVIKQEAAHKKSAIVCLDMVDVKRDKGIRRCFRNCTSPPGSKMVELEAASMKAWAATLASPKKWYVDGKPYLDAHWALEGHGDFRGVCAEFVDFSEGYIVRCFSDNHIQDIEKHKAELGTVPSAFKPAAAALPGSPPRALRSDVPLLSAPDAAPAAGFQGVPPEIVEQIKADVAGRHPESYALQETLVHAEAASWQKIQKNFSDIPDSVYAEIRAGVASRHPGAYALQETLIEAEIESWKKLKAR